MDNKIEISDGGNNMTAQTEPNKKKILVVDDDPTDLRFMNKVLKNRHIVIEASNGIEAVTLSQSHKPDIIFMDVIMPVMDGLTALTEIKANVATKEIPVVIISGVSYGLNKKLAESHGASGYITKPVRPKELLDAISILS